MRWSKITIVGVGLLGGSLGQAIRARNLAREVAGVVRRRASLGEVIQAGAADFATLDIGEGVQGADLIILCTPITEMADLTRSMLPSIKPGALITDVGSVKASVVRELTPMARTARAHFIGGHPLAGSEQSGVSAASGDLFEKAVCVVTPTRGTAPRHLAAIRKLWRGVGADVMTMTAAKHDSLVSRTSHLPHLVASALVAHVINAKAPEEQLRLCATGFRDATRIASGSAGLWLGISLANRRNLIRELEKFESRLGALRESLAREDADAVYRFLAEASDRRDQWCAAFEASSGE